LTPPASRLIIAIGPLTGISKKPEADGMGQKQEESGDNSQSDKISKKVVVEWGSRRAQVVFLTTLALLPPVGKKQHYLVDKELISMG